MSKGKLSLVLGSNDEGCFGTRHILRNSTQELECSWNICRRIGIAIVEDEKKYRQIFLVTRKKTALETL